MNEMFILVEDHDSPPFKYILHCHFAIVSRYIRMHVMISQKGHVVIRFSLLTVNRLEWFPCTMFCFRKFVHVKSHIVIFFPLLTVSM